MAENIKIINSTQEFDDMIKQTDMYWRNSGQNGVLLAEWLHR